MSISSLPDSPARRNSCKRRSTSGICPCSRSGSTSPDEDEDDSGGGCAEVLASAERTALAGADRLRCEWAVPPLLGGDTTSDPGVDAVVECLVPISESRFTYDMRVEGLFHGCSFSC